MSEKSLQSNVLSSPNRKNARKNKPGGGCKMCKPWKGKWESRFSVKEKAKRSAGLDEL